ncbi:MAG: hypothetical protein ACRDID_19325 [Ktedonobacterales bacterium]
MRLSWRRLGFAGAWLVVIAGFVGIAMIALFVVPQNDTDFSLYLSAADALRHNPHATIYAASTLSDTYAMYGGCHPPV